MIILRKYLAREIYAATLLVLVAFLMLFAFFDLINESTIWARATIVCSMYCCSCCCLCPGMCTNSLQ